MNNYLIGQDRLSVVRIIDILKNQESLALSEESAARIKKCRTYLDEKLERHKSPVYGINTGFGYLQNVKVEDKDLVQLQYNLLLSHACGTGEEVPSEIVKLMLLLKIQSLSYGNSGVQVETVNRLIYFYNHDVLPIIYTQGSLGASGDLAPLAHLALPLIGEGELRFKGKKMSTKEWYDQTELSPLELHSKEGLALINGTQFMTAYGVHILIRAIRLNDFTDVIGALSADAFNCRIDPFKNLSHAIRPHKGQVNTAKRIFDLLKDSEICAEENKQVQDPYSFRCMPQVHGASKDAIDYVLQVFEVEINSVTDNPNIFPDEDEIISAGNFHGQPLALALDFMSIALAELGSISERRTYQLISGQRGLPNFLVKNAGLNSGLMIPQYTAASIASENKQLATPASIDSIVSSNGQEDHVSMGANGATKCLRVMNNVERILSIELLTATQALEFRRPLKTSYELENLIAAYRNVVLPHENDRLLATDIQASISFLKGYTI
ncbi:histidine ammonia-lyase [Pedobacter sp. MC2016-24]|uniref:histidine ammonia-lyase n=1 Tax=Pedobacter sp. MC2016-24 TaxID=2780090 RepID=UPI00188250CB|nr:histidine ammonia-lyase [Pedobacter sp. MC2016-24]MBE9598839.1 histidine ammonia-lyase [Pedobacter sp. MC2016-24]